MKENNVRKAEAQTMLHACLKLLGGNNTVYYGPLEIQLAILPNKTVLLKVFLHGAVLVMDILAENCDDKFITFEGLRYASENTFRLKVYHVNTFRQGRWVEELRKVKTNPPKADVNFESINDNSFWDTADYE